MSSNTDKPAILGGTPVVGPVPWPIADPPEHAGMPEVTLSDSWAGFGNVPAPFRAIAEQVIAGTSGYEYAVGTTSTHAIALGVRAVIRQRRHWTPDQTKVLVPNYTRVRDTYRGVLNAVLEELGRRPRLIPIDVKADGTVDEAACADYLGRHPHDVIAIVPASVYGSFPALDRLVELGKAYDVPIVHDGAHTACALWRGANPDVSTFSLQAHGTPTPAGEGGLCRTDDPELASLMRRMTEAVAPARHGNYLPAEISLGPPPAVGRRMDEHPTVQAWLQWSWLLAARPHVREVLRALQEEVFPNACVDGAPLLVTATPQPQAEWPVCHAVFAEVTEACAVGLGLTPEQLRAVFTAEGLQADEPYLPAHLDPVWSSWADLQGPFPMSTRLRARGLTFHHRFLRLPDIADRFADVLDRVARHGGALRAHFAS